MREPEIFNLTVLSSPATAESAGESRPDHPGGGAWTTILPPKVAMNCAALAEPRARRLALRPAVPDRFLLKLALQGLRSGAPIRYRMEKPGSL